ncbi:30S ribosomal protein S4 [Ureaplasma ceti]|uniref:Small ribosomal subunit protein uS4 n=1 Tax=Ureaplasma ceti TaxID=3119530 RepID=A0ABP9UAY7_9BACT
MRYTGSLYRKSRRLGFSLLENNKEFTKGKQRTSRPGQHGAKRAKLSNYGQQLQEKQKLMYLYGMNDRQFRRLFIIAKKRKGATTLNLLQVLESRLDSLVFRAGLAPTRRSARQIVTHNHVLVNGKKVNIPSIILNVGDKIAIAEKSKAMPLIANTQTAAAPFINLNREALEAEFIRLPEREELSSEINESYVVEWFNRLM